MTEQEVLNVDISNDDNAYDLLVRHFPELHAAAVTWYQASTGHAPAETDILHGAIWRGLKEGQRWGTVRNAFQDTWPRADQPPVSLPPQPPVIVPAQLHLEVRSNDFVDAAGSPTCYSGIDRFNVPRMWLDGRYAEVDKLIDEQLALDMNWSRMLFMGSKRQNTIFDLSPDEPGFDQMVVEVTDHHNQRGVGIFGDVFADNQDLNKPMSHFRRMTDLWQGKIVIASGGNEAPKNGWDPQALPAPGGGLVWARGSSLADQLIEQSGATAACFHQRTDFPATIMDAVASEVYMASHGYTVCMCDEPTRFDQDGTNKSGVPDSPRFALALGLIYRAMWDLVVFHCNSGQRGELMSPALRAAAEGWARGLRA